MHRLEDGFMSNEFRQVDPMIGDIRRRWTMERKLEIIEESYAPGSSAVQRHGVAPNLLFRWRRLLSKGGAVAVDSDERVIQLAQARRQSGIDRHRIAGRGRSGF